MMQSDEEMKRVTAEELDKTGLKLRMKQNGREATAAMRRSKLNTYRRYNTQSSMINGLLCDGPTQI